MATKLIDKEVTEILYKAGRGLDKATDKCPKQMGIVIDAITAAGEEGILRSALIEAITPLLKTVQSPERILGFYTKPMIESGLVLKESVKKTIQVEVDVVEKPAKEAKEAASASAAPAEAKAPKSVKGKKGKVTEVAETAEEVASGVNEAPASDELAYA